MTDEQQLSPEIYELLAAGRKVAAIKLIRQETGLGLADAKELADALSGYEEKAPPRPPMTEEGGAGGLVAIIIAIIIAIFLYAFFLSE